MQDIGVWKRAQMVRWRGMKQVIIWGTVLAILVGGVLGTQKALERADRITREKAGQMRRPTRTVHFTVNVMEGSERVAEIEADEGTEETEQGFSHFKGIRRGRFFDEGNEIAKVIRAKDAEGTYNRFQGLLDVKGEIVIATRGKYELRARRLIYNKTQKVMVCPEGVDLRDGKGARFAAKYGIFLPGTESAMLIGGVRGTLTKKTTITLMGDFLRHSAASVYTEIFGGSQAELQMPQTTYYVALLPADLKPELKPGKAGLAVKGYRMEGEYIQVDRESSRVSLISGGVVTVGKGNRLEASGYNVRTRAMAQLDYYWDRGFLFGKGNIRFAGENGETGEADEVSYIADDRVFQFAGNVTLKKPKAGWLYREGEANEGTLKAGAVTVTEDMGEVKASGSVGISEGERQLEGEIVKAWRSSGRLYVEKGRLVTEEQELTAKVLEITGANGWAQGQVRLVKKKDGLDVSASRLKWTGKNRVELEGPVTGRSGEDRFEASQVTVMGSKIVLVGKAELRREDKQVNAEEIQVDGEEIVAEKNASVKMEGLSISAGSIEFNGKTARGTAKEVREIVVEEGMGAGKGALRIQGETAEFGWEPVSLTIPGPVVLQTDVFRLEGQDFEGSGKEGSVKSFVLRHKRGVMGSGGFTMSGDQIAFKGEGYEASGDVVWKEGGLEVRGEKFKRDGSGNVVVSGRPTVKVPSQREMVTIQADEMTAEAERQRIAFQGNVVASRGAFQAKAEAAYFLMQDQMFVLEGNVEVQRSGGDSLSAQRVLINLVSGKIMMEEATGQVHY